MQAGACSVADCCITSLFNRSLHFLPFSATARSLSLVYYMYKWTSSTKIESTFYLFQSIEYDIDDKVKQGKQPNSSFYMRFRFCSVKKNTLNIDITAGFFSFFCLLLCCSIARRSVQQTWKFTRKKNLHM